jgi:hypothetical protein
MKLLLKIILTVQFLSCFFLLAQTQIIQAAEVKFRPQVEIPQYNKVEEKEFNLSKGSEIDFSKFKNTKPIALYIRVIYKYAIGIVGILATVVMMAGGLIWLTAGGNQTRIGEAKSWITASVSGLIIALCSYLILATVNPALVDLNVRTIKEISEPKDPQNPSNFINKSCCINKLLGIMYEIPLELDEGESPEQWCEKQNGSYYKDGTTKGGKCIENTNVIMGCCLWNGNWDDYGFYYINGANMTKAKCEKDFKGSFEKGKEVKKAQRKKNDPSSWSSFCVIKK